jgi:predicted anti-sigma-YlaC factor YlaD
MKDSCPSVSNLLAKYFDQEVTDEERSLVETHLPDCPQCQNVLDMMAGLRHMMKNPVEEAIEKEDFPWVWEKIKRGIRLEEKLPWWKSLRSWLNISTLLKRRVWIPAVATIAILMVILIHFEKNPSYSGPSVVEYIESQNYNVMIYESEKGKVTVIWLFEGPEEEGFPS